jgi:transposase InsO family protein
VGRRPHLRGDLVGVRVRGLVIDAFSGFIVGWQTSRSPRTDLALDALEMAIWRRQAQLDGLVHHSDRGSQPRFKGSLQHRLLLTGSTGAR